MATTSIVCPHCHKEFPLEATDYADIVKQVRDHEFAHDLAQREELMAQAKDQAVRAAASEAREQLQKDLAQRDARVQVLEQQLAEAQRNTQLEVQNAQAKAAAEAAAAQSQMQAQMAKLQQQLDVQAQAAQAAQELAVAQATQELARQRDEAANLLKVKEAEQQSAQREFELKLAEAERTRDDMLRLKDEQLARERDLKARMSTKMVGETLEQHCEIEFNRMRAIAFPNAYFGKDNDVKEGTKGDYVFREEDESGVELISIMFEMKNETDTTSTKKRNADFFKKLDADRTKKGCEYAILVSLLEPDSELYNGGIVEVAEYPKMYVIRPQLFLTTIGLLRNMAKSSLAARKELAVMRSREVDVTNFEEKLEKFRTDFGKRMEKAGDQHQKAIDEIDKVIDHLEKVKAALKGSEDNLGYANKKLEKLTIRSLTYNNATMKAKFAEAREARKLAAAGEGDANAELLEAEVLEYDDELDADLLEAEPVGTDALEEDGAAVQEAAEENED